MFSYFSLKFSHYIVLEAKCVGNYMEKLDPLMGSLSSKRNQTSKFCFFSLSQPWLTVAFIFNFNNDGWNNINRYNTLCFTVLCVGDSFGTTRLIPYMTRTFIGLLRFNSVWGKQRRPYIIRTTLRVFPSTQFCGSIPLYDFFSVTFFSLIVTQIKNCDA